MISRFPFVSDKDNSRHTFEAKTFGKTTTFTCDDKVITKETYCAFEAKFKENKTKHFSK